MKNNFSISIYEINYQWSFPVFDKNLGFMIGTANRYLPFVI